MNKIKIIDLAIIPILTAIIFVQEQLLSFLPNIQFTVFLLVLYSKKIGLVRTSFIAAIHTILDCLITSSLNIIYTPFMLVGWLIIPFTICLFCKRCENPIILALLGAAFSFIYSWLFFIPNCLITHINIIDYFFADILFELLLASSSFLSILWLYRPCGKAFDNLIQKAYQK